MAVKNRVIKDWAISRQIHWVNDKWTVLMKPALLGEKTSLAGLKTLIIILLLRYDVYDDIVDLSQTFLVVEEVRRTEGIFTFPELLDISS